MDNKGAIALINDTIEESMLLRVKDNGCDSRSGSDNADGGSGDDQDAGDRRQGGKKYHRHTPFQIQILETTFKETPHPDEKQRAELSRKLGLECKQIKFWFQNRRTQMKTQLERHENVLLRQENDRLRAENEVIKNTLPEPICNNCGGPVVPGPVSLEYHQIRMENARLKDELSRILGFCKFPPTQMAPPMNMPHFVHNAGLDLAIGRNGFNPIADCEPSYVTQVDSSENFMVPLMKPPMSSPIRPPFDMPALGDLAVTAMDELLKKTMADSPLWFKWDGRDAFNYEEYSRSCVPLFSLKPDGFVSEATRETSVLPISSLVLIEILMDMGRYTETFSTIIAQASTALPNGVTRNRNGDLIVVFADFQYPSPLVPVRNAKFLRFCKQHTENTWAVVDVSIDLNVESSNSSSNCRRLPSGCLIQDMSNGFCKVTWVEHAEYHEGVVHPQYRDVISSGRGFGASRWLLTLQRFCESASIMMSPQQDNNQTMVNRSMLRMAHRMVESFCSGLCGSGPRRWDKIQFGSSNDATKILVRRCNEEPGEPTGIILGAATSAWLPVSRQRLFEFLTNEKSRKEWDLLNNVAELQEMLNIPIGPLQGNAVSLSKSLPADDSGSASSSLLFQETWNNASFSMMVYAPVDFPSISCVLSGGDSLCVAVLPSGIMITSAGAADSGKAEGDRSEGSGSLLTVGFQILLRDQRISMESVETLNNLIVSTVERIKAAFVICGM